jgi:CheY-like chemotaxis protein
MSAPRDVLVIDDSATVRKLVEISLRGKALRPHFAETGGEGIRLASSLAPAAILLDFVLPDMTGIDVCRALAAEPRTQSIPILVVTAKHERTRAEFQPFSSVVDFMSKPFAGPDLIARIERAVGRGTGPVELRTIEPRAAEPRAAEPRAAEPRAAEPRAAEPRRDLAERAAKLLFGRLRDGLALLPSQFRALEPGPIAPQLARRLLTPQVVEGILADLRPLYAEAVAAEAPERSERADRADRERLEERESSGELPGAGTVVDRAPGFSARVQAVSLSSLDRRVLAHADGRLSIAEIARRLAVDPGAAARSVRSLIGCGLLHAAPQARPVVICEPDVASFQEPLRSLLARRARSRELIAVDRIDDLIGVTRQRHACLVMVNATSRIPEVCAVAQALRADLSLSDLAMVAVLEARVGPPAALLSAGFDAILAKPVIVNELERFLIPTDLR